MLVAPPHAHELDKRNLMTTITRDQYLSRTLLILIGALGTLSSTGCVHRIAIQQGNFLQQDEIDRVAVGMTRVQVRALLGTPMVADPFHPSRWDYLYYFKSSHLEQPVRRHFIVYFDAEDKVERIERIGVTPTSAAKAEAATEEQAAAEAEAAAEAAAEPLED